MINYIVKQNHAYTIKPFLHSWVPDLADRVSIITYEELPSLRVIPAATTIFSDLERLEPNQVRFAAAVRDCILSQHPDARILNDPDMALGRYDLLKELYKSGLNPFRVERLTESTSVDRFPVFLRYEHTHQGPMTPLLHSQEELDAAIVRAMVSGRSLRRILVVEYCDTSNDESRFFKYAAFVVGDQVLARHVKASNDWVVKGEYSQTEDAKAFEIDYLRQNPHRDSIANIARLARLEYGRVDYSLIGEDVVTWEINTNPLIVRHPDREPSFYKTKQDLFLPNLALAFHAIDSDSDSRLVSLSPIPETLRLAAGKRESVNGLWAFTRHHRRLLKPAVAGMSILAAPFRRQIVASWARRASQEKSR